MMMNYFVQGCATCQQMKPNTHPMTAPLMLIISHATRPFQQVTMDFITDLPVSNGFDSIFIVVNQGLSKGIIICPCNKTINANKTMKLYINNVFINSDYLTLSYQTEDCNLHQKYSTESLKLLESKTKWAQCFTLKQMDRQNTIIRNLKLISKSIAPTSQMNGITSYL